MQQMTDERLRKLFVMWPDHTVEEIANELLVKPSQVNAWASQIRSKLKAKGIDGKKVLPTKGQFPKLGTGVLNNFVDSLVEKLQ